MVGIFLSFFLSVLLLAIILSAGSGKKEVEVKANSVLHLRLNEEIPDRAHDDPMRLLSLGDFDMPLSLREVTDNIHKAAEDGQISGVFLDLGAVNIGTASLEEVRNALLDFKKSGKFIYAYSEVYSQASYYLASVADKIFLHPTGLAELKGLRAEMMFFKGMGSLKALLSLLFRINSGMPTEIR